MPTHSYTTIDLTPDDDDERDQIIARAAARPSTARASCYYVDLPGGVTIYGDKPLLHEILTQALAALHADDDPAFESLIVRGLIDEAEPAADPELVPGEVVAIRVPAGGLPKGTPNWELEAIGQQVMNGLPRSAA